MKRARFAVGSAHELPEELPPDENVLWQGAPGWWPLTRSLHLGVVAVYFGALLAWYVADKVLKGVHGSWHELLLLTGLASVPPLLLLVYAWLVARTTSYTLTTRRLVVQVGVALPISFNIPYACIEAASLRPRRGGAGDIAISLLASKRLSYVALWPHVRGGHAGSGAEPVLRAVPDVQRIGRMLSRLLEGSVRQATSPAPLGVAPLDVLDPVLTEAA